MKTMKKMMTLLAVAGVVLALAPAAQAADVTWETAVLIEAVGVGDSVISTEGTLVQAFESGSRYTHTGDKTVNGVLFPHKDDRDVPPGFADLNKITNSGVPTDPNGVIGDDFEKLLFGIGREDDADGICDVELRGLVDGESYLVQFLVHDERTTGGSSWDQTFTGGANTSPALDCRDTYSLVGRFVADGTTQAIRIEDTDGIHVPPPAGLQNPIICGVQWRLVPAAPTGPTITLDNNTVASNAAPGELVGTLGMDNTNAANFAFSVVASGPDYTYFDIATGTTNLRTAKFIDSDSYDIMILATNSGDGFWVTNAFTITATDPGGRPNFVVGATVAPGDIADDTVVGVMQSSPSATTYSLVGGRTDMFDITGVTNLVVDNAATAWTGLVLGDVAYVSIDAVSGSETNTLIVGVEVADTGLPAGTIFLFQ